ncbi:class I SAM-dependent methyltransferase [Pseudonocardia sp. TRM90224]|uniref:class I SAM-dependent methyltransferase n=1 Tax=Pseudonocardia sp. TRM90224 TaxID=2812678 RepID=UPI001E5CD7EE|nr:class I SAM-dependent methyltransferase [Pseudonocardia sp. TRM90224]
MQDVRPKRRKLVPEIEGASARWYAKMRGSAPQMASYRTAAASLTAGLAEGATVLEIAPGPGYQAVEIAKLGFAVTGLDISRTMVQIAGETARSAGVEVDFRHGDAGRMPFRDGSFDLVVCQAAFKNFAQPVEALDEMHRVLHPGGVAVIQDLDRDATDEQLSAEVEAMGGSRLTSLLTTIPLRWLRRRAYSRAGFEQLAARSAFGGCTVTRDGITLDVRLTK